jgi:hypothetical protein
MTKHAPPVRTSHRPWNPSRTTDYPRTRVWENASWSVRQSRFDLVALALAFIALAIAG